MELLVTIAIILILSVLLFSVGGNLLDVSKGAACTNGMRQLGSALWSYQGEHNGWFPPGHPVAPQKIDGVAEQPGIGNINFYNSLVPSYMDRYPVCPGLKAASGSPALTNMQLQKRGGGYGINAVFLQWKASAMPWPDWNPAYPYSNARMPFLLEVVWGSTTWDRSHLIQTMSTGLPDTAPRSHGHDLLNFMFIDGHIERIARNDSRGLDDDKKSWVNPENPTGPFHVWGKDGRYILQNQMSLSTFKASYPSLYQ